MHFLGRFRLQLVFENFSSFTFAKTFSELNLWNFASSFLNACTDICLTAELPIPEHNLQWIASVTEETTATGIAEIKVFWKQNSVVCHPLFHFDNKKLFLLILLYIPLVLHTVASACFMLFIFLLHLSVANCLYNFHTFLSLK